MAGDSTATSTSAPNSRLDMTLLLYLTVDWLPQLGRRSDRASRWQPRPSTHDGAGQPPDGCDLAPVGRDGRGVLVEESQRFVLRSRRQQERDVVETEVLRRPPVLGVDGGAE